MIKGLYETHLPVTDLQRSIAFYRSLGLELALAYDDAAFFWIEPKVSWLGLWVVPDGYEKNRTPASFPGHGRHIAFRVDFGDIRSAKMWLAERGIEMIGFRDMDAREPIARPHQQNASVYFYDPDGNHLELISNLPEGTPNTPERLVYLSEAVMP
jgi:catechol 2,3-dioxygenase-like lactoylglutathione lyase family enzyme